MMRYFLPTACFILFATALLAQPANFNPIKWSFTAKDAGNCEVDLIFTGILEEGWSTYSQFLDNEDGPVATTLNFAPGANYKLIGKATESGEIVKTHDVIFNMNLAKFKHKAILTQRVQVLDPSKPITGYLNGMTCNDEMCLPPKDYDFSFKIPALTGCTPKNAQH
jgi:thiol:disulfide interchange protein DsbD